MSERVETLIALAASQVGAAYVFGAWGGLCSTAYRLKYAGYTPAMAGKIRQYCPVLAGKQSSCAGCRYAGRRAFDCRGLTHWCLDQAGVIALTGQGANSQYATTSNWDARGEIASLPDLPGIVLFRRSGKSMAHTGLYIGSCRVVHAKGHAYGVVETALSGGGWTHWAAPNGLYTADQINAAGKAAMKGGEEKVRTIKKGSTGEAVKILQQSLVNAGFILTVDGSFGKITEAAVKAYQEAKGLTQDGVVGALTWAALGVADEPQTGAADAASTDADTPDQTDQTDQTTPVTRAEFDALKADVDELKARMNAQRAV